MKWRVFMRLNRKTENIQAETSPDAVNCRQAFCLLLLILFCGCATDPPKPGEEHPVPAIFTKPDSDSSEIADSPAQSAVQMSENAQRERQTIGNPVPDGEQSPGPEMPDTEAEKPESARSTPARGHMPGTGMADEKKEEKISPQEENIVPQKPGKVLPSGKINFRVQNEDLMLLLRVLARAAGISIMISENVKGKATIDIQNKPWDQVFTGLLRTHGLMYEWEGDIVRVMTVEDIGHDVRELELQQKREAQKRGIETVAPFTTAVIRIDYADANNLKDIFEKFLEEGPNVRRGSVMVDRNSNSIIVQAREKEIEVIRGLAEKLDRPTRQIRIEAQIIEANSDTAMELGIEWGGYYSGSIGGSKKLWVTPGIDYAAGGWQSTASGSSTASNSTSDTAGRSLLIQRLPSTLAGNSGLLLGLSVEDAGKYLLGIQLSALEEEGKIRILSNPSISTLDNHTAVIESGREVPYQTVEDNEVNIEFKKAALSLEVTPHVIEDNLLKMKIITSKDELDFSNPVEGNPTVITKKAQTTVILRDGQTMVIGGLRKETENKGQSGIPVLRDIPLLGNLFKKEYRSSSREEILIFITPRIVK